MSKSGGNAVVDRLDRLKDPDMPLLRRLAVAAALAPLALSTVAAYAPDPLPENCRLISQGDPEVQGDELEVCQVRTYFECPASGAPVVNGTTTTWSETEPGSFTEGNGCAMADPGLLINTNQVDTHLAGTFTGRLESLNIHVNLSDLPYNGALGGWVVGVTVRVDGVELYTDAQTEVQGAPVEGTEQQIREYVIGVDGIGETGFADDGEHDIDIVLSQWYIDTVGAHYMGAAEVDSGIDFNPTVVSAYRAGNAG